MLNNRLSLPSSIILLSQVQAVYLLTDDERSASSAARSASKYDLYVSSTDVPEKAFANSARRLDNLLQKLRSPAARYVLNASYATTVYKHYPPTTAPLIPFLSTVVCLP